MAESISNNKMGEQFVNEPVQIGLPWRMLVFSFIIFAFIVFVYVGLRLGYKSYLDSRLQSLDKNINALASQVNESDQQKFISFYSQIVNLKKVLDRHDFASNAFAFLERNTLGKVYYIEANLILSQNKFSLKGKTNSLESLVEQLTAFEKTPELEEAILGNIKFDKDGLSFEADLIFKDDFFNNAK